MGSNPSRPAAKEVKATSNGREVLTQSPQTEEQELQPKLSTTSPTLPAAPINMDSAQLEWHTEMLCGMFLRSNRQDLEWLEREVTSHKTSRNKIYEASTEPKPWDKAGGHEDPRISQEQTTGDATNKKENAEPNQDGKFLMDLLNLGESMDSTVLSLIPEALRGVNPKKQLDESDDCEFNNPLLVPSTWRRSDYSRRSLPEFEHNFIDSGRGGIRGTNINSKRSTKNGKNGSHPTPDRGPKACELFSVLYNECSLTAMANWTMLDFSANSSNGNSNYNKEEWEKTKKIQEKRRAAEKGRYEFLVPPSSFHLCSVCGGFGHYEAECDLLLDDVGGKRERETNSVGVDGLDTTRSKKKKRVHNDDNAEVILDAKEKNRIISSVSNEIHIQRRQRELYEEYRMEKNSDGVTNKEGVAHSCAPSELAVVPDSSHSLNKNHTKDDDDEEYTGKSSYCKICQSGIDDKLMLLCDGCDELFHAKCLDPPLESIPEGDWFCSNCVDHDSDANSIVDIEGCGEFVIEQRKRSVAEEAKQYSGVSLGQSKSPWTSALAVLPEENPIVENESYFQKHLGRQHGHVTEDFFLGELCWAKHGFNDQLLRVEWWPAMVVDSETRSLKSSSKTTYTVTLFALDEDAEIHETEILPFLPYFEDIGYKRLSSMDRDGFFRRALVLSVAALGLKSVGQTLKIAREGVQMVALLNNEHRKLLPSSWKVPEGWESADIDKVDDIMILSKENDHAFPEALDSKNNNRHNAGRQSPNDRSSATTSANEDGNPVQDSFANHKMVAKFCVDELVGSIVSWHSEFSALSSSTSSDIRYGVVVSIDTVIEKALVRTVPMLSDSSGNLDSLFNDDTNELLIHASNVGSTIWIPLRHVRFVSGKPSRKELVKFRRKLKSNMSGEMKSYSSQCDADAKCREEFFLELEDLSSQVS